MKWSLEAGDWDMVHTLYTVYQVGIPVKYIYSLPQRKKFTTSSALQNGGDVELSTHDPKLREVLSLFPRSKWNRLEEWDNSYGYRYL